MIEVKEKDIDGVHYKVRQFRARQALKIKTKLIKLIAPSAFRAISSGDKNVLDADLGSKAIASAVDALVERLDEDNIINLILELLSTSMRDNKEITEEYFDRVYAGRFDELYKAIFFVLEVNYGSFLRGIGIGKLKDELSLDKNLSQDQTESLKND